MSVCVAVDPNNKLKNRSVQSYLPILFCSLFFFVSINDYHRRSKKRKNPCVADCRSSGPPAQRNLEDADTPTGLFPLNSDKRRRLVEKNLSPFVLFVYFVLLTDKEPSTCEGFIYKFGPAGQGRVVPNLN